MSTLRRPFQLGRITLPSNVFCAPLAGCSDLPFRRMTSSFQPGLVYCEMTKMEALIRNDANTYRMLEYTPDMHPIGAQICGSKPQLAGKCAKIIEDLGFDVVDLNCGCPVDKVTKDGSGSGLLKSPELIGEILSNMVAAVKIPVTVKIRTGWDEAHITAVEITKIAEKAGASAICIHGRTRAQGYKGPANWDRIRECKEAASTIQVIGNGDITSAEAAEKIFTHTGCDAILVARGTMGQPWIIEDIYRHFADFDPLLRTGSDHKNFLLQHLEYVLHYQTDRRAMLDMRRIGCWYLRKGRGARELRETINRSSSLQEMQQRILDFPWELTDFSSQEPAEESDCEVTC
jgi:tRNA-dihydrouridine synthase B